MHVLHVPAELEPGLGWQRRQHAEEGGKGCQQRQHLVPLGLGPEELLQLGDLLRMLGREVVRLAVIIRQVIELDRIAVRVPDSGRVRLQCLRGDNPRDPRGPHRQPPAVLVHRPVADGLEVLLGVPLRRRRVGERAGECNAVHRLLIDPVHRRRDRDARDVQDGRRDVDDVRELRAEPAGAGDPLRPVDDHRVPRAAQVRAHLLAPLERGVAGPRPRRAVMRIHELAAPGFDAAVALGELQLHLVGQRDAVLHRQLVERAGDRAFHARAVVAPDPDDHRVAELTELVDGVDHAAHVVISVLGVARVHLHLPGVEGLQVRRARRPRRGTPRSWPSARHRRVSRRAPSAARRSPPVACPTPGRTCPCTCRPRPWPRDAGRGCSRWRSR